MNSISVGKAKKLPPLTEEEENILEQKMVWMFAAPRSGTTWIGSQLLKHPDNVIWFEPWIGLHLGVMSDKKYSENDEPTFERVFDANALSSSYFFSPHHKDNWMPALRKFILARAYSEAQTLSKNLIIKEPVGSQSADIIMECFPKSKLIFLVRDGRDVLDSRVDMHTKNSWAGQRPINNPKRRQRIIEWYSYQWIKINERIENAYNNHDPSLRLLIKYEELKEDTLSELKKIYDFIGVKISEDELQQKILTHDFKKIPDSQKGKGKFYRAATTGSWKENFSEEEQELMNNIMKNTLKKFEYDAN